jgi:1-acyl-sn-glycerol-3-phosphate acyltransferase
MNLASLALKAAGWTVNITVPNYSKCIICVAPHTSNWDFILGKLAYAAVGRNAGFLMKDSWFFWPLGPIFRSIGGVPVIRNKQDKKESLVDALVRKFNQSEHLQVAITPEGTRSRVTQWRTGFLRIAQQANVPIVLGAFDYKAKTITICQEFKPTGDIEADLKAIKHYYSNFTALYPDKFSTEDE